MPSIIDHGIRDDAEAALEAADSLYRMSRCSSFDDCLQGVVTDMFDNEFDRDTVYDAALKLMKQREEGIREEMAESRWRGE